MVSLACFIVTTHTRRLSTVYATDCTWLSHKSAQTIQPIQNTSLLIGNVYHYIMQSPNRLAECKTLGLFETCGLFEPSPDGYLPVNSPVALIQGDFVVAGNAMAMSVVHLGPSPSYCHPAIVAALSGERLPDMTQYSPVDPAMAAFVEEDEAIGDLTSNATKVAADLVDDYDGFSLGIITMTMKGNYEELFKLYARCHHFSTAKPLNED
uniref:Uncharacterized protein n=1 Tax=Branchiostoma floridae TaxID=7739 RepID=C3ZUM0_BRAFL|eukprot:XP_002587721.1 hypothetical protein BRAFLDRAFT_94625 [Branchiostoma floridae]